MVITGSAFDVSQPERDESDVSPEKDESDEAT
jgi:hypothetical protein